MENAQLIRVHEYGHTIQSLVLGPFMLFVGIISVAWGDLPYFRRMRWEKHVPYTACFVEYWASKWGELVTKENAIWQKKTDSAASLALIALSCILHVVIFRGKVDMNHSVIYRILSALLAVVIVLPIHELIHWISMCFFGRKDARIEIARDPFGLPSLRTIASGKIENWKNNIILLAPFFLLTVIPDAIFLFSDRIAIALFIAAASNSAGCCFDLLAVLRKK